MPIKLNGTTFNNGGTAKFNGTSLKKIVFNSTTVWEAQYDVLAGGTYKNSYSGDYSGSLNGNTSYVPFSYTSGTGITYDGSLARNNTRTGRVYITTQINASNYSSIVFKFSTSGASWSGYNTRSGFTSCRLQFGLASALGSATTSPTFTASKSITSGTTINSSYTIDISAQTGNQYIAIWVNFPDGRAYSPWTITDIYMT